MVISKLSSPGERLIHLMLASREAHPDFALRSHFEKLKELSFEQKQQLETVTHQLVSKLTLFDARMGEVLSLRIGLVSEPLSYPHICRKMGYAERSVFPQSLVKRGCALLMKQETRILLNEFLPEKYKVDSKDFLTNENILDLPFSYVLEELWLPEGVYTIFMVLLESLEKGITTRKFIEDFPISRLIDRKCRGIGVRKVQIVQQELQEYGLKLRE